MIIVDLPARVLCDEPGCEAKAVVQLCLTASGGFAFRPPVGSVWQVGVAQNGTFATRCEKHAKTVHVAPAIPSLIRSTH